MKVSNLEIDWNLAFGNDPMIVLHVDELPTVQYQVFEDKERHLYWGERDGFVEAYLYNPKDQSGFGGALTPLELTTGEVIQIKGPWYVATCNYNDHFEHIMEVKYKTDNEHHMGYALVSLVQSSLNKFKPGLTLSNNAVEISLMLTDPEKSIRSKATNKMRYWIDKQKYKGYS
jgi:hypothetical protein